MTHLDLNEGPEQKLVGIDMSRIVTYPGFNAPLPDNCEDKPIKGCPKWSQQDNYRTYVESYCRRQGVKILQKRRISDDNDTQPEDSSKKPKLEMDSDIEIIDELEEKQSEFVPGWVAREEPNQEGSSNKGLPSRSKWAKDVNEFEVAAYQPAPTKTGAYLKLQKTLKQKNEE